MVFNAPGKQHLLRDRRGKNRIIIKNKKNSPVFPNCGLQWNALNANLYSSPLCVCVCVSICKPVCAYMCGQLFYYVVLPSPPLIFRYLVVDHSGYFKLLVTHWTICLLPPLVHESPFPGECGTQGHGEHQSHQRQRHLSLLHWA